MWLSATGSRPATSVLTVTGFHMQNFNGRCVLSGWLGFVFSGVLAEL
jgi:hypothetical protein